MSLLRSLLFGALLSGCVTAPRIARPDPQLEALVARGVAQRTAGHDLAALETFRLARARSATPRVLAQLALAEQANARWLDAMSHLEAALRAAEDPWITRHRSALDGALEEIAGHVGQLFVGANVDGAELRLDGARVATLPMREPIRVAAGSLVLEVRAEGYSPVARRIEARGRELTREAVRLLPSRR